MVGLNKAYPGIEDDFVVEAADRFLEELQAISSLHEWTGTYRESFSYEIIRVNGRPAFIFGHLDPVGDQADRLPIYWKVLERGASPNLNMPTRILAEWSSEVLGNPAIGYNLAKANQSGARGIKPNPILSFYFQFDGDLNAVGLDRQGMKILEDAFKKYINDITTFLNRAGNVQMQTRVVKGAPGAGQFGPKPQGL